MSILPLTSRADTLRTELYSALLLESIRNSAGLFEIKMTNLAVQIEAEEIISVEIEIRLAFVAQPIPVFEHSCALDRKQVVDPIGKLRSIEVRKYEEAANVYFPACPEEF